MIMINDVWCFVYCFLIIIYLQSNCYPITIHLPFNYHIFYEFPIPAPQGNYKPITNWLLFNHNQMSLHLTDTITITKKYSLIIGPAGTGKSYIIKHLTNCHKISPTNPSARIIGGQTIYNFTSSGICNLSSKEHKFQYPLVVVDEVFLFNKHQMSVVLDCMNDDTQLILFGDPYQLR